jgi:urease accessory protein
LPLLIQRPLYGPDGEAVVVLLTPAGALFDGDAPRLEVSCEPGTDVTVASAAATKLNRCDRYRISFELEVHVVEGATFRYLPYELIPFRGTRYLQKILLDLRGDARAWLLEVVGPGASAEPFAYGGLDFETEVRQEDAVLARERFIMTPSNVDQMRGFTHYGSLLTFGSEAAEEINARLACLSRRGIAGASALPGRGVGLKMLGHSAQTVRETLLEAAGVPGWLWAVIPP